MTPDEKIGSLLTEIAALNPDADAERVLAKYDEATALVDRVAKPQKWAAFRALTGVVYFKMPGQLNNALQAFRDSLPYWDRVESHAQWAQCKSYIGWSLFGLERLGPTDCEEIIDCLEATLADFPDGTPERLALCYSVRAVGDPLENWQKRVHYLQLALTQTSVKSDPLSWARLRNDLAKALPREPDGNYAAAIDARIQGHSEALAVLALPAEQAGSEAQNLWIGICIDASEAWLDRLGSDPAGYYRAAGEYAQSAHQRCNAATPAAIRALAALGLARWLLNEGAAPLREHCHQALDLCGEADSLIVVASQPALAATSHKFKALAYSRLLQLGEAGHLEDLVANADVAYALQASDSIDGLRRVVMQIAAQALIVAGDFVRAAERLNLAEHEGQLRLEQASIRAGRLECIFDLHDSASLLGYCLVQSKDLGGAVEAIDRNKGLMWQASVAPIQYAQIRTLVPCGGALLFPVFAPSGGAVVVVTEHDERSCALPGLGRQRLEALLFGEIRSEDSDSWLARYVFRHVHPQHWTDRIDSVGALMFESLWAPVIEVLEAMNVSEGAELVLFPQAGLGALPLHAGWQPSESGRRWMSDRYAIRYAASARALFATAAKVRTHLDERMLLVVNPSSDLPDLPFSTLELFWASRIETEAATCALVGAAATKAAVTIELGRSTLAHFAAHGCFDVANPFDSSLVLAGGERLTLGEWLPLMADSGLRTVILSACETAVAPAWRKADEMIGFPAALLEHGVATVIATLWPVDDFSAAVLIGRFYREWQTASGRTAAQAMRAAQNWLREVSADELYDLLESLVDEGGQVAELAMGQRRWLGGLEGDARPFSHPQFWAAFTVSGH